MEFLLKYLLYLSYVFGVISFLGAISDYKDGDSKNFGISLIILILSVIYILTYHQVI